jgi:Putative rRNA methylase
LSLAAEEPLSSPRGISSLLDSALSRAQRTLADKNPLAEEPTIGQDISQLLSSIPTNTSKKTNATNQDTKRQFITQNVLNYTLDRSKRTLSTTTTSKPANDDNTTVDFVSTDLRYNQNPAISLTALAHWLWSSVLRPHQDVAIDATCGHGQDAVGIASILFGNEHLYLNQDALLICVDVQAEACQATHQALSQVLPSSTLSRHVQIVQASHAPLPEVVPSREVGLVVYNLGYLPSSQTKAVKTQVDSTLASIIDALLLIRIGGMVSIMTYPGSNRQEDKAVRTLLEAAVAMTNRQGPSWQQVILEKAMNTEALLMQQLLRLADAYETRGVKRTFRVTEHKKIGLESAPILMTATRIK